jgi:hypothetical protein
VLPNLVVSNRFDVVLIDGGHAFPIPFIDWHYTSQHLKKDGVLIVDDIDLRTVNILYEFLSKQPDWKRFQVIRRTAFFRKVDERDKDDVWDYWHTQPFNRDLARNFRKLWLNIRHRGK